MELKEDVAHINELEDEEEENMDEVVDEDNENENCCEDAKPQKSKFLTPAELKKKNAKEQAKYNVQKANVVEQVDKMLINQIEIVVKNVLYCHIEPKDEFYLEGSNGVLVKNRMEYVVKQTSK